MGTNYYLHPQPDCPHCGRPYEPLHIGKSSIGWAFSLHVMPEENINTLDDWRARWNVPGVIIRDEYGRDVTPEEIENTITKRTHKPELLRHEIDGSHCIGAGPGSWDYVAGWFS